MSWPRRRSCGGATRTSWPCARSSGCKNVVDGRKGGVAAAEAAKQAAEMRVSTLLPAQKASAEAALKQAQVDLDKTVVYAGVSGRVEQFILQGR